MSLALAEVAAVVLVGDSLAGAVRIDHAGQHAADARQHVCDGLLLEHSRA